MPKNANGEGSITKRKSDGLYMGRYTIQTDTGPKRKTIYGKDRDKVAEKLTQAIADRNKGLVYDCEGLSLAGFMVRWLEDSVKGSVKRTSYQGYERLVRNHISPSIGHVKLKNLKPAHLQGLYRAKLDAGLSPRSVQYIHATLHRALKIALRWELVARNVADSVIPPKVQRKEMRCLNREQAKKLLSVASDDRYHAVYVVALHCGMRQGEILALDWNSVDLDAGVLQVRRTLSFRGGGGPTFSSPKSGKGRTVRLSETVVSALVSHRARQYRDRLKAGSEWQDNGLVFCTEIGTPLRADRLDYRSWKPLLRNNHLPDVRFHDLRHTCASLLLESGVHVKIVSELLGHASIAITLDTYSHVLPSMGDAASTAMESALS